MDPIIGHKVVEVRQMTKDELKREGWDERNAYTLVLDNGVILYASRDIEGNGPGCFFGYNPKIKGHFHFNYIPTNVPINVNV